MTSEIIDVDACPATAFALQAQIAPGTLGDWHHHQRHQLLYASRGTLVFETQSATWWLPPLRAAFIPGRTAHRVRSTCGADLCAIYLTPPLAAGLPCGVFAVTALAREMLMFARRWNAQRDPDDQLANLYFETVSALAGEWVHCDVRLQLPMPTSSELKLACDYLIAHIDEPSLAGAARAAAVSERTLSRRFREETGGTLRHFVRTARVLSAMEALCDPQATVTEVAFKVGFEDASALSCAFKALLGESPSGYQRRVLTKSNAT